MVFVCDGAQWIWKLVERYFPGAVQIVDWYHASQYLPPIAEAAWGINSPTAQAWLAQARTSLWNGQIADLIQDCRVVSQEHSHAQEAVHRAGARWTEIGALHTAKARAAWLSGDWAILAAQRAALPLAV